MNKAREKRLRRLASERDLQLIRSWLSGTGSGERTYALIDPVRKTLVLADPKSGFGMTLDEIERFLEGMGSSR